MQLLLGGKRDWKFYRYRMKILKGAENIANLTVKEIQKNWMYIKGGQACLKAFIKANSPEDWDNLESGITTLEQYETVFQENINLAQELKEFAEIYTTSYTPLFQFRESLFENLPIYDPHGFLLDESEETILDPIHLLRYYEFENNGKFIEITARAKEIYQLNFSLRYYGNAEDFKNKELNKLTAWKGCKIKRALGGAIYPTPLIKELEKNLISGVIISTAINQGIIIQLRKQSLISYPIK
jgi:CRISPR-associated endonuclease/helicase Cas3